MLITKIRVQNLRIHDDIELDIAPGSTIITGPNGSGKTSLVEAIYIALRGSSFKGVDDDVLRAKSDWYRVDIHFDDDQLRTVKYEPYKPNNKKQFDVAGRKYYRLPPKQKLPIVIFEPDDLRLISGSPARRRKFIDNLIGLVEPGYYTYVRKYERALQQRNAALKAVRAGYGAGVDLFAWNIALAEYGEHLIARRGFYIDWLNNRLETIYQSFGPKDKIAISYSHPVHDSGHKLLTQISAAEDRDKMVGFTTVGPHRHDVIINFNGVLADKIASRGEIRSVILAMKFAEIEITKEFLSARPLVILDDVYSELDPTRQKLLTEFFSSCQTIITSTEGHEGVAGVSHRLG